MTVLKQKQFNYFIGISVTGEGIISPLLKMKMGER
jgi:hypothetical protein